MKRYLGAILAAVLFLASPAKAQELYGPMLDRAGPSGGAELGSGLEGALGKGVGSLNPVEVLAGASKALDRGDSSAGGDSSKKGGLSTAVNILLVLTVVSLAPSIILMSTCFVRVLVVLGFLKQALGTQSIPPPQVITGLALMMTALVMAPTIEQIRNEAVVPYQSGEIRDYGELWERAKRPMRDFMFRQIEATGNWSSLYMLMEYRGKDISRPERLSRADVDMVELVPAYMLSELKVSFLMGFRVYLPFLVIDMVVSTMLISMSMMMLPPVLVSLPFKILLFVLVDGWALVVGSLMHSVSQRGAEVSMLASGVGWFG
jgi:flagellar biosynthetic protein FliP